MKVTVKPSIKTVKVSQGTVITRPVFDTKVTYVGCRVATSAVMKKALGLDVRHCTQPGFLVVSGDKPGILLRKVKWDGKDVYMNEAGHFGSLKALNAVPDGRIKAQVLTEAELLAELTKVNRVISATSIKDGKEYKFAILNGKISDIYIAGVRRTAAGLEVRQIEPKARYNAAVVQYRDFREVSQPAKAFLAKAA